MEHLTIKNIVLVSLILLFNSCKYTEIRTDVIGESLIHTSWTDTCITISFVNEEDCSITTLDTCFKCIYNTNGHLVSFYYEKELYLVYGSYLEYGLLNDSTLKLILLTRNKETWSKYLIKQHEYD